MNMPETVQVGAAIPVSGLCNVTVGKVSYNAHRDGSAEDTATGVPESLDMGPRAG